MSFFNAVKQAANLAVEKTKQGVAHLRSLPTEVECKGCNRPVMIPPQTYNWNCASCTTVNNYEHEHCSSCNQPKPSGIDYTIQCTMCHTVNPCPTSNAVKMAKSAAENTKKAAIAAKVAAERQYDHLKSRPEHFNCAHCHTLLATPPPSENADGVAEISVVICPVCKQQTNVPKSNFANSVQENSSKLQLASVKLYYDLAGKRYAQCPVCKNPVKAPEVLNAPTTGSSATVSPPPYNPSTGTSATVATTTASASSSSSSSSSSASTTAVQQRVDLFCEKCQTHFPAVV